MMCTLSQRRDIQDKLRAEILDAQGRFGTDIPYDDLVALPYMDAFVRESLRLCVIVILTVSSLTDDGYQTLTGLLHYPRVSLTIEILSQFVTY